PIGLDASLQRTLSSFTSSLLASDPPIEGLDASIVVPARRVHITLGVMSLVDELLVDGGGGTMELTSEETLKEKEMTKPTPTLSSAIAFLQALRPRILEKLEGGKALVPLERIDVMKNGSGRGKGKEMAHVLYAAPAEDEDAVLSLLMPVRMVGRMTDFIHGEFLKAGYVVDEGRPLKVRRHSDTRFYIQQLHATLLNTIYRRPRPRNRQRIPFNLSQLLASDAVHAVRTITLSGVLSCS
ncbi:hypothetical protein SCHPADRAFT_791928, partial [Schizopora paradoxa]